MKVRVDDRVCEGFGLCSQHLPEVFRLDEQGFASVEGDGLVPAGLEGAARSAIDGCPTFAIRELDGDGADAG
jgi:ferredoxin